MVSDTLRLKKLTEISCPINKFDLCTTSSYQLAIKKHLDRMSQHKDFDIRKLGKVVTLLAKNENLPMQYKDHELKGEFKGVRECHVQNDILLLYTKHDDVLLLLLVDIGTHSSLFRN